MAETDKAAGDSQPSVDELREKLAALQMQLVRGAVDAAVASALCNSRSLSVRRHLKDQERAAMDAVEHGVYMLVRINA